MTECPECGADVPADGAFCPECGTNVKDGSGTNSPKRQTPPGEGQTASEGQTKTGARRSHEPPERDSREERFRGQRADQTTPDQPNPEDHKLLFGSVVVISAIGLLESLGRVLAPDVFADELVEAAADTGMEIERALAEQVMIVTGVTGIAIGLVVAGLTIRNYRNNALQKRYFWVLIAAGVGGFLVANSLFLTVLVAFGIYGLVSVMD